MLLLLSIIGLMCVKIIIYLFMIILDCCPRIPVSSLVDSWPSLLALLKDSVPLGLPAPGQFLILGLVSLFLIAIQGSVYPHNIL